jgi:cytochrome c
MGLVTVLTNNLRPYLHNPREVVPGTNMSFPGLRSDEQISDVIAYFKSQG